MGLALAHRLAAPGNEVHVFERAEQLGGLATHHDFGQFSWDRFYHVILPTDAHLLGLLSDIGLQDKLRWQTTQTGFYVDREFHPLNSSLDFLRFPPLSLWGKFRLAMTILYCSRINDWRRLEKITVEEWLIRTSGRKTYEKLWKPLLLAKLGENYRRVSAVFIWTYIKRMFSARESSAQKEQLGHVSGGYRTVFDRIKSLIEREGGSIRTGVTVQGINALSDGRMAITTDSGEQVFDKVIVTSPVNVLRRLVAPELIELSSDGRDVEYRGVICMAVITRTPLMPYYVLNIADDRIPFTGAIGMSNLVATEETAGLHITYLPKYVLSDDPILQAPEDELREAFLTGVKKLFPDFPPEDIESVHINRAIKVQPLQVIDYSTLVPATRTRHPALYVLNTAQFVNGTLNNNEVVGAVNDFVAAHGEAFGAGEAQSSRPLAAATA